MRQNIRIQFIPPPHQRRGLISAFGHGERKDMGSVLVAAVQCQIPGGLESGIGGLCIEVPAEVT